MFMTFNELIEEQKKPLEYKEQKAVEVMREAVSLSKHRIGLAFSGGKDSEVLWDLQRRYMPEITVEVIFGNTGVEFPESLKFARQIGREWGGEHFHEATPGRLERDGLKYQAQREVLEWLVATGKVWDVLKDDGKLKSTDALERACPPDMYEDFKRRKLIWKAGTPLSYWWCCDQYGFPILGKAASKLDARRINIDCFLKFSKSESTKAELLEYYDLLRQCKISQHCCTLLKKEPSERMQAELDVDVIFKGLMASESRSRKINFCTRGYIFESTRDHLGSDPFYHCNPISIWTDDDIWAYIGKYDLPYSPLYDMGYTDSAGVFHPVKRNGCIGCATDIAYANNHLSMLRRTHPERWEALMRYGMAEQLRELRLIKTDGMISIFDVMDVDQVLDMRPCAFDRIDRLVLGDDTTQDEYDPEEVEVIA